MKVASLVLLPYIDDLPIDVVVAASGTSCRHQIHDGAARTAIHPAKILRDAFA